MTPKEKAWTGLCCVDGCRNARRPGHYPARCEYHKPRVKDAAKARARYDAATGRRILAAVAAMDPTAARALRRRVLAAQPNAVAIVDETLRRHRARGAA